MSLRQLLRKPRTLPSISLPKPPRRFQSTNTPPNPSSSESAKPQARASKVLDRTPRFLRKYTDGLRNAPVTHIVSFLVLHELTAIVPLFVLAGGFHYTGWLPPFISEYQYISVGLEKFGRYFRRKGWFGFPKDSDPSATDAKKGEAEAESDDKALVDKAKKRNPLHVKLWNLSETGSRVVVEVATAYAIVKVLLPIRIVFSVWATPWFARTALARLKGLGGRLFKRKGGKGSPAAGTGATGKGESAVVKGAEKSGKN